MSDISNSIAGVAIRVTSLQANGSLATGASASYTTRAFISLSYSTEFEEGDELTQKNAGGEVCGTYKAPDTLKRVTLAIALCNPDAHFMSKVAGATLLSKGGRVVGWAPPKIGENPTPNGVAIEVWSKSIEGGKPSAVDPYYHFIFPFCIVRESGERVIQNDIMATEFEGWSVGNTGFGSGPSAPLWGFPEVTDRAYAVSRVPAAPTVTGYTPAT